jgi:hypothetical protein
MVRKSTRGWFCWLCDRFVPWEEMHLFSHFMARRKAKGGDSNG